MDSPLPVNVFVVRVYETAGAPAGVMNVIVEDTRTARRHGFTRWADLQAFLMPAPAVTPDPTQANRQMPAAGNQRRSES